MVGNPDVIRALERIADLLEVRGENAFKVRAYRTAAAQVENLGEQLADIAKGPDGLRSLGGFGPAIAEKVTELLRTGRLAYLEELEAEVPCSLLEITSLPGVGPRTVNMLWKEAGITSLEQLEGAARSGRLAGLPRLGAKSVDNILRALDTRRPEGGKVRRPREAVTPLVDELLRLLHAMPACERAEVAGSFRRGRESVRDLDLLVSTSRPGEVLSALAALPRAERVLLRGDSKCSIVVDGLQVDCRAVTAEQFGAAWQYFTGSQAHNIRLRGLAVRMGLTLNEYGVFRGDDGARVAGASEEEVYAALGLPWVPPEKRENGELPTSVAAGNAVTA